MNVEIGAEAALFPEKEYIKGIFFAVYDKWLSRQEIDGMKESGGIGPWILFYFLFFSIRCRQQRKC
jgi:hypothetical protein